MKEYLQAIRHCFTEGIDVDSRAGKVRKAFGYQMRFELKNGFPALFGCFQFLPPRRTEI